MAETRKGERGRERESERVSEIAGERARPKEGDTELSIFPKNAQT
jgi:hypothetical protein